MSFGSGGGSSTENINQNQTTSRSFNTPEAKRLLASLSGAYGGQYLAELGNGKAALGALSKESSAGNPYLESQISAGQRNAQDLMNTNMAKVRAAGYRGGTGANAVNQGLLAQNFALGQAQNANQMRYQDYADNFNRRIQAATALTGAENQAGLSAQNMLNMLGDTKTSTTGTNITNSKQKSSNIDAAAAIGAIALMAMA